MDLNVARTEVECGGATPYCVDGYNAATGTGDNAITASFAGRARCSATPGNTWASLQANPNFPQQCSAVIPTTARPAQAVFNCRQSGIFPNLNDCTR